MEIYNMLGQKASVVTEGNKASGYHEVTWNASDLSSGIFLINFTAVETETGHNYNQVKKALLLKLSKPLKFYSKAFHVGCYYYNTHL